MDSISEWLQGMGSGIHAKQRMCQVCLAFKVWRNPLCFQNYSSKSSTAESVYQVQDWTNNLTFIVSVTPWVRKHKVHQWSSIWLPHFTSSEVQHWDSQRTKSWTSSAVTPKEYRLRNQTQLGKKNLKHEDDSIIRSRIYHPKAPPQHAGWLGISGVANLIIPFKSLVVYPLYNNISLYTPYIYMTLRDIHI